MTKNREALTHHYIADLHRAIAQYLELKAEPITDFPNSQLQEVWHTSFERFGPTFAEAVEMTDDDYLRGRL
jgi:hypothetical protein